VSVRSFSSRARKRAEAPSAAALRVHPLTDGRWNDLVALFGDRGAYGGCWCMWWRLPRSSFAKQSGAGNRRALRRLVRDGVPTGLLGYVGGEPVGWIAVGPRETLPTLERSRVLRRVDGASVWSITCLFVARAHRASGVARQLITAAVEHVRERGGHLVEAYPTEPRGRTLAPVSSYMGTPALFARNGFRQVARPSAAKTVMRREVTP